MCVCVECLCTARHVHCKNGKGGGGEEGGGRRKRRSEIKGWLQSGDVVVQQKGTKDDGKVDGVVAEREKGVETGARGRGGRKEGRKEGVTHKMEVWRRSSSERVRARG